MADEIPQDSAEAAQGQSAATDQINAKLARIEKAVERVNLLRSGLTQVSQNLNFLSQQIHNIASEQAHVSASISNLNENFKVIVDIQQKSLLLQQQQLLEDRLTRIAAQKTACETQRLRELAEAERTEREQQANLLEYWHSVNAAVQQTRENPDTFVKQVMLLAIVRSLANPDLPILMPQGHDEMLFAEATQADINELAQQLQEPASANAARDEFLMKREKWTEVSAAIVDLSRVIAELGTDIARHDQVISYRTISVSKVRTPIIEFFYNTFMLSKHERQLSVARSEMAEAEERRATVKFELDAAKRQQEGLEHYLKQVQSAHPAIAPFQPWSVPAISL